VAQWQLLASVWYVAMKVEILMIVEPLEVVELPGVVVQGIH
jgi:hypothetical protein